MEYNFSAEYNEERKLWCAQAEGEVDIFNSNTFRDGLLALLADKQANIVINCAELKYIDSTGLGALVAVLKNVKAFGGDITLRNLKPSLAKLFKITSLDKSFIMDGDSHE